MNPVEDRCADSSSYEIPFVCYEGCPRFFYYDQVDIPGGKIIDKIYIDICRVSKVISGGKKSVKREEYIPKDMIVRSLLAICRHIQEDSYD